MAAGDIQNKSCNGNCDCKYKLLGIYPECSYSGFCDFQAPRDSRGLELCTIKYCECGMYNACTTNGTHCAKCGLPLRD